MCVFKHLPIYLGKIVAAFIRFFKGLWTQGGEAHLWPGTKQHDRSLHTGSPWKALPHHRCHLPALCGEGCKAVDPGHGNIQLVRPCRVGTLDEAEVHI